MWSLPRTEIPVGVGGHHLRSHTEDWGHDGYIEDGVLNEGTPLAYWRMGFTTDRAPRPDPRAPQRTWVLIEPHLDET